MKVDTNRLCEQQETCLKFSNGTKRKVHHIRITDECLYWRHNKCVLEGNACELSKIRRIKADL